MSANIIILLIEDDQDDIELLQGAFSDLGINADFDILMQGHKIISWMESSRLPDVIVMDLNLPMMHGREVICRIKENQRFSNIPVMVLTTSSQEKDRSYCLEKGADKFVSKPSTNEGFVELVNTIVALAKGILN
jgi:CheY-like chemotaxis protein